MKSDKEFRIYAQVRATRQAAGDIAQEKLTEGKHDEYEKWYEIEGKLNDLECKLERI